MIAGAVDDYGVPTILLEVGGMTQAVIVDTGFNGDLELPESYRPSANARHIGRIRSLLAGGQSIEEDHFLVTVAFDGRLVEAEATFATEPIGLIGTRMLGEYRLEIDFPQQTLRLIRP